jgi:hypothetical protein
MTEPARFTGGEAARFVICHLLSVICHSDEHKASRGCASGQKSGRLRGNRTTMGARSPEQCLENQIELYHFQERI